jgi:hypothetical protein
LKNEKFAALGALANKPLTRQSQKFLKPSAVKL